MMASSHRETRLAREKFDRVQLLSDIESLRETLLVLSQQSGQWNIISNVWVSDFWSGRTIRLNPGDEKRVENEVRFSAFFAPI